MCETCLCVPHLGLELGVLVRVRLLDEWGDARTYWNHNQLLVPVSQAARVAHLALRQSRTIMPCPHLILMSSAR